MAIFASKRPQLDGYEQHELDRLKAVVSRHISDYATVGQALRTIRDKKLYRATHDTFESFLQDNWQMERTHAYRLIAAADVASNLSPTGDVPKTEHQARPLTSLDKEQQRAAWAVAKDLAGGQQPTAAHIEHAAEILKPRRKKKSIRPLRVRVDGAVVIIHPGRRYAGPVPTLMAAIEKTKQTHAEAA